MARILLDMDGVLTNLIAKWFRVYNEEYGDTLHLEQLSEWGPHRFAKAGRAVYKYLSRPGFFRDLEPIPGAVQGVRRLLDMGHEVVIVTAAKNGHRDKADWVREHLPFLPDENIVFAHRKELVRGDVLFDDAPHNLEAFRPYGLPVAMDYPYNRGIDCARVSDWAEFPNLIAGEFPGAGGADPEAPKDADPEGGVRSTGEILALRAPRPSGKLKVSSEAMSGSESPKGE